MEGELDAASMRIPQVSLGSNMMIPQLGMGTAVFPLVDPEMAKLAILQAIEIGYRHFDTSPLYQTEQPLGEAIEEALSRGMIQSRNELFISSKLWCSDAHHGLVQPALKRTLKNLKLKYLDLYLIHFPISSKPGFHEYPIRREHLMHMDFKSVWENMEECQRVGLTKSIGVSNFSCKKLASILAIATIPPAVNQVEMNPLWQQKKLVKFCEANGIVVVAYSPLGAKGTLWGTGSVMECKVLQEIAEAKGKTLAQICLRWLYEQGMCVLVKSFNKERMKHNLQIFDWKLSQEELDKIGDIPQSRSNPADVFVSVNGPFKTVDEFWDGEI